MGYAAWIGTGKNVYNLSAYTGYDAAGSGEIMSVPVNGNVDFPAISAPIFWAEIAPSEHIAQFYEHDSMLLDTLTGFVGGGVESGESSIVIATRQHLRALEERLNATGVNVTMRRLTDQYITVLAEDALETFMVKNWPDDERFSKFVMGLIERAGAGGRPVRAFGEMVALLWARGDIAATIRLEYLWNKISKSQAFSLFCAYPKTGFTEDASTSMAEICAAHSRVI
jgi:hypothetical protein